MRYDTLVAPFISIDSQRKAYRSLRVCLRLAFSRSAQALNVLGLASILTSIALSGCSSTAQAVNPGASQVAVSPFVSLVHLNGYDVPGITGVQYTIAPKPGAVSAPVHVEYSAAALKARGYLGLGSLAVPVFGLYSGYQNEVSLQVETEFGTAIPLQFTITTPAYVDPTGIYTQPDILTPRTSGGSLGFNFIFIKSNLGPPIIVDTDGEVRWAASGVPSAFSSDLSQDTFIIGASGVPTVSLLRLDGALTHARLPGSTPYVDFNHNIERGKVGFLAEVDAFTNGVADIASNVAEIESPGLIVSIPNHWDLGAILSSYMTSHGDDAAAFVRPGSDWFHSNAAFYDAADDSVLVSSRENFVIKLDYQTGAIRWIFGDPTKYWYTFPSLRAKALALAPGGLYPIGQHGISITSDGYLMLFNDGLGSLNQPAGAPAGETRTYSAVSAYSINDQAMTATNVWNYRAHEEIYSDICSSAYEANKSVLVDYAVADSGTQALLVGLDSNHQIAFEFEYATYSCNTSWNARPIPLDNLVITQ